MPINCSMLAPGQEVSRRTYTIDGQSVQKYREATSDTSPRLKNGSGRELVPPMAVAALGLRGVLADMAIPGGTLHAGQELDFTGSVPVGESLECRATLAQNSVRGQWRFMIVQMEAYDSGGRKVLEGKSSIMVPV